LLRRAKHRRASARVCEILQRLKGDRISSDIEDSEHQQKEGQGTNDELK
jgi:hypothetical protein